MLYSTFRQLDGLMMGYYDVIATAITSKHETYFHYFH